MTSRPAFFKGRGLARLAVACAVAISAPLAIAGTANATPDSVWDRLAKCESGGNWKINTGNGHQGGLQFTSRTWRAFGGSGNAGNASRAQQIAVAERVLAAQGWGAWPSCSRKIGARGHSAESSDASTSAPARKRSAPASDRSTESSTGDDDD